jgi:hypothetical protein
MEGLNAAGAKLATTTLTCCPPVPPSSSAVATITLVHEPVFVAGRYVVINTSHLSITHALDCCSRKPEGTTTIRAL